MLKVLAERDFPLGELKALASKSSAGKKVYCGEREIVIEEATESSFKGMDFVLGAVSNAMSKKFAPAIVEAGAIYIDNSSAFRLEKDIPLVVPQINPEDAFSHHGIIANPNCSTIQAVVPLKALDDAYGIKRIVYSTYQAVSGAGQKGYQDLEDGLCGALPKKFPHPIAGNCIPHIDVFLPNGNTKEEQKMIDETRKILNRPDLRVTATCVRVPVYHGHSESINVELKNAYEIQDVRALFERTEGVIVKDDPANNVYPMPIEAAGTDPVYVGRIRRDESVENGLNFWCVADNIRKGAATNAVQILQELLKEERV